MLKEINQMQKDKYGMTSLICEYIGSQTQKQRAVTARRWGGDKNGKMFVKRYMNKLWRLNTEW
jgi:hypothetical protein